MGEALADVDPAQAPIVKLVGAMLIEAVRSRAFRDSR